MIATDAVFLALDNGSQSVRALIFDGRGQLLAKSRIEIEPYVAPQVGWAEQDPNYYWQSLCDACHQLWREYPDLKARLQAVSVTTQRGTVVTLDDNGEPVYPAITWMDQRTTDGKPSLKPLHGAAIRLLGAKSVVDNLYVQAEANWLAQHRPELWQKVSHYLLLSGYHHYRLTGHYVDAVASQVGYLPFDFKRQQWASASDWRWQLLPLTPAQLPRLYQAGQTLGQITAQAAKQTGIPQGLPVIASGSDKACEVLGSGCLEAGIGSLSYGTTATFNGCSPRYREIPRFNPAFPAIVPDSFNTEIRVQRGYWLVSWFKREFGLREQTLAAERGVAVESLFDDLLASVPPGSQGLTLQPYWSSGAAHLGDEARGAIIGFSDTHTRAHIYRALIEGLTYALREGKEQVEKRTGIAIHSLRVSGGGSQSDEVMQITADIFGMEAQRPHTYETSGLGAAMAAAVGVGVHPDFNAAAQAMTHLGESFKPIAEHQQLYDRLYRQVYQKLYKSLQPHYQSIRQIMGVP